MIALIIPIYPKHYCYIEKILNKISIDVYLVFSNKEDYNKFSLKEKCFSIILNNEKYENMAIFKKFYALNLLKNKYKYYIALDTEIDIIEENFNIDNIKEKIENFIKNKKIFCGETEHVNKITKTSINVFKDNNDKEKLKKLTLDYKLLVE